MRQAVRRHEDLERGEGSAPRQPSHPSHPSRESIYDDSSGPLFNMYSKVAEEEDNKMAELWQKDADGILIFTGLFSAAVATLLAVSIQDLKPNPQDTSAFYLKNIYQLLANPNTSSASIPPAVLQPTPFTPPRYAIWVNSLWFLSLVVSLTCALLATLLHQWARRYVRNTQPPRCSPEKRARMRAFFSGGVDKLHLPWVVEVLPTLVHLSLFLFFAGLLVFISNINHTVFNCVTWWIALFSTVYGCITLMPIFRHDSPYYAPLSASAWLLYASIQYIIFGVLSSFNLIIFSSETRGHFCDSRDRYRDWILRGRGKAAEETVSERSSEIDLGILEWAIDALGEDDIVEKFFEAIPRFFNSDLVQHLNEDFPDALSRKFWGTLEAFLGRTLLSNSVFESVKIRRLIICLNATNVIHGPYSVSKILYDIFEERWGQVLQSIETGHILAPWCRNDQSHISEPAKCIVTNILTRVPVRKRNDRWIALVVDQFDIPEHVLRDHINHGNNVLLYILIQLTRQAFRSGSWTQDILWTLSQFNIHETLLGLQRDFCALWNEIALEARRIGISSKPLDILREIRHAYIDLHQGTHASPTAFSASTGNRAHILYQPSSYPLCDISCHRANSTVQTPIPSIRSLVISNAGRTTLLGDLNDAVPLPRQHLPAASLDIAATPVIQGDVDVFTTFMAHHIPRRISSAGTVPQQSEELSMGPLIVSDSTLLPIPTAAVSRGIPVGPPSAVEPPRPRSAPGSPSSSRILAHYHHLTPHFSSVSDPYLMPSVGRAGTQYGAHDMGFPALMEEIHYPLSASVDTSISENTPQPEDHQHGLH